MVAGKLLNRVIFIRELAPQDLKLEIERLTQDEAKGTLPAIGHECRAGAARLR
jgi:hypothetical protein